MCLFNVKDGFLGSQPDSGRTPGRCAAPRRGRAGAWTALAALARGGGPTCHPRSPRTRLPSLAAAEGVVRGYKLGLLTTADYNNLCQCETLEDIKLYLVGGLGWAGEGGPRERMRAWAMLGYAGLLGCSVGGAAPDALRGGCQAAQAAGTGGAGLAGLDAPHILPTCLHPRRRAPTTAPFWPTSPAP